MKANELQILKQSVLYINDDIAIKPACEAIGIDYKYQISSIKKDEILSQLYKLAYTTGADKKQYEMFCLPKHGFLMWIYKIEGSKIKPESRQNLITIQSLIHEYLYSGEKRAKAQELYIAQIRSIEAEEQECKETIAAQGRRLKEIKKIKRDLLASDPNQLVIDFDAPKHLTD